MYQKNKTYEKLPIIFLYLLFIFIFPFKLIFGLKNIKLSEVLSKGFHSNTIILIVVIFFKSSIVYPQTPNVKFEKLGMEQGLSFNMITDILQDQKGFIWIATWNGLNRYDGYNFKIYKHLDGDSTSLRVNKVACLLEDKSGRLWVGTFGGGLSLFNREEENFTNFIHNPNDSNSIITDKILSVFEDSKSRLWIGTSNIGVSVLDKSDLNFSSISPQEVKFVNLKNDNQNPYSLKGNGILSFEEDEKGNIWLGSYNGWLNKLQPTNNIIEQSKFLSYYPNLEMMANSPDLSTQSLFKDKHHNGIIWIIDYFNGVYWFDRESEKYISKHPYNSFSENFPLAEVGSIEVENDEYWIGGSGMNIYNFKLNELDKISPNINHYNLNSIKRVAKQNLFIEHLYKDRSGILWIGTESRGLFTLKNTERFLTYSLPVEGDYSSEVHVLGVLEDNAGNLWIGTTEGLFRYNDKKKDYKKYRHNPNISGSISSNIVYNIHQDSKGEIWIGTAVGLGKFNKNGLFSLPTP